MSSGGRGTDNEHQTDECDDGDEYDGEFHARAEVLWHRIEYATYCNIRRDNCH